TTSLSLRVSLTTHSLLHLSFLTTHTFFFNPTATTTIYTLSLHDALPISAFAVTNQVRAPSDPTHDIDDIEHVGEPCVRRAPSGIDRKSTRLNSSHVAISYAVFCLKKKTIRLAMVFIGFYMLGVLLWRNVV